MKKGPTIVNRFQDNDFLCLSDVEIHTKFVVYFSKVFVDTLSGLIFAWTKFRESRGSKNFAKRGSFKFRDFENPILLQVLSVKIGLLL